MMKKIGIMFFALALLVPAAGWADELKLIKGKGVEVCEAYQQSLKSTSLQDMVCGEKDDTDNIKRPKWEKLDLKEHKELVKKIEKFFAVGDQFGKLKIIDDEKEFEGYLSSVLKSNFIQISTIDIANNSKSEKILLYSDRPCNIPENIAWNRGPYSRPLFVLDEVKNQIDVEKTEPLLQNPFPRNLRAKAVNHLYQLYEIFFYKSKTYFDKWNMRDKTVTIYKQSKNKVKEICKYRYEQNLKKQGGK